MSAIEDLKDAMTHLKKDVDEAVALLPRMPVAGQGGPPPRNVARVGGDTVTASEIQSLVSNIWDMHANLSGMLRSARAMAYPAESAEPVHDDKPEDNLGDKPADTADKAADKAADDLGDNPEDKPGQRSSLAKNQPSAKK